MRSLAYIILLCLAAKAEIIAPSNRVDFIKGRTVGLQVTKPVRTSLIDVTAAPYSADKTGAVDATTAIQSAVNAAGSNDVVYFPDGVYLVNDVVTVDKSYVTLRGQSTNAILRNLSGTTKAAIINLSHDVWGFDSHALASAPKGATNIVLAGGADPVTVGFSYTITKTNVSTEDFPVISVFNADNLIGQYVHVVAVSGSDVTLSAPLVWDFTGGTLTGAGATAPRHQIGVENLTLSLTNYAGQKGGVSWLIAMKNLCNSWISNVVVEYALAYGVYVDGAINSEITGCDIHHAQSIGPNHSGIMILKSSGLLVENNIIRDGLYPGLEVYGTTANAAVVGNFFTNNEAFDIITHNTHPLMNLFEQNIMPNYYECDGYFGSISHQILFRNWVGSTWCPLVLNRWTSRMQVVGNVLGREGTTYSMYQPTAPNPAQAHIVRLGYPNIGNGDYTGTTPPMAWNYPQNPKGTVTADGVSTTNIQGNFEGVVTADYVLFQDNVETNTYWPAVGGPSYIAAFADGTGTNLLLNKAVTVSNGWILHVVGPGAWQQRRTNEMASHLFHGNYDYFNNAVTWDAAVSDHDVPASLIYNAAPSYWGTNRWPAIDPTNAVLVAPIPAELRYAGIDSGESPEAPATPAANTRTHTISGTINIGTLRRAQ